jgi:hypothetical protein
MKMIGNRNSDMKFLTSVVLLLIGSAVMAQSVPNTFTPGTPAVAAEVNENFANLDGRVNTNASDVASVGAVVDRLFSSIEFQAVTQAQEGVAAALCPADTLPVSASCYCEGDGSSRNYGYMFSCFNTMDGAVAGCYVEADLFDPNLPEPMANVAAVCIGATLVNGDLALTNPWSAAAVNASSGNLKPGRDMTTELAVIDLQNAVTNRRSAIAAKSQ